MAQINIDPETGEEEIGNSVNKEMKHYSRS